jgi:YkoY family integral membrane protein
MFGQTFVPQDLVSIATLVVLEALLSADNALVLAIMVRHLPEHDRKRALLYGLGGAFVFRLVAIVFAAVVLEQWWLQALGGAYLAFLAIKHFVTSSGEEAKIKKPKGGFWPTVIAVELTDIAFALDSVLAGIAFITVPKEGVQEEKLWVVVTGAMIGIVLLRFAANSFSKILDRFPGLDHVAYTLVGWVGVKLLSHAFHRGHTLGEVPFLVPGMSEPVFWGGLAAILLVGVGMAVAKRKPKDEGH